MNTKQRTIWYWQFWCLKCPVNEKMWFRACVRWLGHWNSKLGHSRTWSWRVFVFTEDTDHICNNASRWAGRENNDWLYFVRINLKFILNILIRALQTPTHSHFSVQQDLRGALCCHDNVIKIICKYPEFRNGTGNRKEKGRNLVSTATQRAFQSVDQPGVLQQRGTCASTVLNNFCGCQHKWRVTVHLGGLKQGLWGAPTAVVGGRIPDGSASFSLHLHPSHASLVAAVLAECIKWR